MKIFDENLTSVIPFYLNKKNLRIVPEYLMNNLMW